MENVKISSLDELNKIKSDIDGLERSIRQKESSLKYLSSVRKGEHSDKRLIGSEQCISHFRNNVDSETQTMFSKYVKSFESDIIRMCEIRVESQIRGMKTKKRMLETQLKDFFND